MGRNNFTITIACSRKSAGRDFAVKVERGRKSRFANFEADDIFLAFEIETTVAAIRLTIAGAFFKDDLAHDGIVDGSVAVVCLGGQCLGIVVILILALAVALFVIDLIYPLLDPRIRYHS